MQKGFLLPTIADVYACRCQNRYCLLMTVWAMQLRRLYLKILLVMLIIIDSLLQAA
jgi:hypothetical protein